jgi:Porin PorA
MSKGRVALIAGAVVFAAAGLASRYYVVPNAEVLTKSYSSTSHYEGTVTMLNPVAVAAILAGSGDPSSAFISNVPVTAVQVVKGTGAFDGGSTIVLSSDTTVKTPDGTPVAKSDHVYAVDKKTVVAVAPPAGSGAENAQGLPLGFAFGPEKKNYDYWDSTTLKTAPATFSGTESKGGRTAYVYKVDNKGKVADPGTLAQLPKSLPKAALLLLAPDNLKPVLTSLLPTLPDQIDLAYDSSTTTTLWVDSVTGSILDSTQHQIIMANVILGGQPQPARAVLDLDLHSTAADVAASAKDAKDNDASLKLLGVYGPIGAGVIALLLLVLAFTVAGRKRAVAAPAAPAAPAVVPQPGAPLEKTQLIEPGSGE